MPIDDGTTRNILTHYGQVSLENTSTNAAPYVNTLTRDAQDNNMFYYFLSDSQTNQFRTTVLLYAEMYTVTNVPVAFSLLKQIIILTRIDNPASTMHIRETLIESRSKLVTLKGTSLSSISGSASRRANFMHESRRRSTYSITYGKHTRLPPTRNL